jgi:exodeoxyribonuclease V alpha subunit
LGDIVKSGICPVIRLEKIFRQASRSLIVVNAHAIVDGYEPDLERRDRDFFFLSCPKEKVAELVSDLAARRLPKSYGYDPLEDIQVISPSRIGLSGTQTLNLSMRERLNPPAKEKRELRMPGVLLREGDKVMQVRNSYDIQWVKDDGEAGAGMFNGDIGRILNIERRTDTVTVRFDDRIATYSFDQARFLEPAFAVTVHKSQGSEFPAVILAVGDTPRRLCYRNLLYTAVTRARNLLVIVGNEEVIRAMVENDRRMLRYTCLKELLQGEGESTAGEPES